jgi:uncharacterized protein YecE (DUF72 family)
VKDFFPRQVYVGCAGWALATDQASHFPTQGSHLERYAGRFPAVEINTSFYRPHRPGTYARWAASVPDAFRFAVKVPREITHKRRLIDSADVLEPFLAAIGALGVKLGTILVQLPPSLVFSAATAATFFALMRQRFDGNVVCEPRHVSWFTPAVDQLLAEFRVGRVAADPAVVAAAAEPGGWHGLAYYRLHGSPRMYYSSYSADFLDCLATRLAQHATLAPVWCIFDNTAAGAAQINALDLLERQIFMA